MVSETVFDFKPLVFDMASGTLLEEVNGRPAFLPVVLPVGELVVLLSGVFTFFGRGGRCGASFEEEPELELLEADGVRDLGGAAGLGGGILTGDVSGALLKFAAEGSGGLTGGSFCCSLEELPDDVIPIPGVLSEHF